MGEQAKELGNLGHWLKVRRLVAETDESWFTAAALAPDVAVHPIASPEPTPEAPSPRMR